MITKSKRNQHVGCHVTQDVKTTIRRYANKEGISVSAWMARAIDHELKRKARQ